MNVLLPLQLSLLLLMLLAPFLFSVAGSDDKDNSDPCLDIGPGVADGVPGLQVRPGRVDKDQDLVASTALQKAAQPLKMNQFSVKLK